MLNSGEENIVIPDASSKRGGEGNRKKESVSADFSLGGILYNIGRVQVLRNGKERKRGFFFFFFLRMAPQGLVRKKTARAEGKETVTGLFQFLQSTE